CQHVEPSVLKAIMVECINFTFYRAGEAAFEAGQTAKSAFFIERGTLEYQQNRRTSKVKRKLRVGAHNEIIIAEAALWTFWDYVGTLTAPNPASMLKLDVEKHTKIISESELMGEFAAELALHFRTDVINLKLMTLGDAGVGKSTLVHSFCADGEVVLEAGEPTIGADFKVKMLKHAGKDFRVNIWDASGDLKFIDVRNEFYKEAQGVVLVFDVTSKRSFQNLEKWTDEVTRYAQGSEPIYAVVGTKTDLHPRLVQEQVARDWAKSRGMPYFEVSGAQGRNVEMVFKELASRLS
ncbi:rab1B, partial [Symbiodinium microadriaticum]